MECLLNHKMANLSKKYFLVHTLCYKEGCPHRRCMAGNSEECYWYNGGPLLTYFPFPVPDPSKPWGAECSSCQGQCAGHYMKPQDAWLHAQEHGNKVFQSEPPSVVLQNAFNRAIKLGRDILEDGAEVESLARETHLTLQETLMWLENLKQIRMRRVQGAKKAAAKRSARKGTV